MYGTFSGVLSLKKCTVHFFCLSPLDLLYIFSGIKKNVRVHFFSHTSKCTMHIFRSNVENVHAHFITFFTLLKISGTSGIRLLPTPHHHQPKTCFTRFCNGGNLVLTIVHYLKKQVNSCSQSWFMVGSRGLDFTFFWVWAGEMGPPNP